MNILLIEDMAGFAQPIKACLEAMGHAVTWVAGVQSACGSSLTGILASTDAGPMTDSWDGERSRLVAVDLSRFDLALSDGDFLGAVGNGWDVVPTLAANGIACVAISGAGANNPLMVQAGACAGLPKEFVVLALRQGVLDLYACLEAPDALNGRLAGWVEETRTRVLAASRRGQRIDLGYPFLAEMEAGL